MAKRKDTKAYQECVYNYCNLRRRIELRQNDVDKYYKEIGKAKRTFDNLGTMVAEKVKEWYNFYTSMQQTAIGMIESNINYDKKRMAKYETTLVDEYEEDLDELYNNFEI
jgi:hypothetical protein